MPFDLETWKREAAAKLAQFKRTAAQASSHMTYTTLATMTLWPAMEAIGRGDVSGAIGALMGAGAAAGAGIITQKALEWKGKTDAEIAREAAQWIEQDAVNDPALRRELDKIMTELRAVAHAQAGMTDADRAWLVETLRRETARIGSTLKVVKIKTSGGMVIGKEARVKAGGDVIGRDKRSTARASRKGIAVSGSTHVTITQKNVTGARSGASQAELRRRYLKALAEKVNELPLRVFNPNESYSRASRHEMHLSGVYIALDTTALAEPGDQRRKQSKRDDDFAAMFREERNRLGALEAVFRHRRAAILGKPGSGKSTFAKHLAYCLAVAQTEPKAALTEFWQNGWSKREKHWLPIFVILRDFDAWLRNLDPKPKEATAVHLRDFIRRMLEPDALEYAWPVIESALSKGKALVVLDGLDEVPTTEMRLFVRDAITEFVKRYSKNRYLLTCRSESYLEPASDDAPDLRVPVFDDASVFTLADLDRPKIEAFITRWYAELQATKRRTAVEADHKCRTLLENVYRYDLLDLAANPLQLTLMAWVHTEDELPQKRAKLYEACVKVVLQAQYVPDDQDDARKLVAEWGGPWEDQRNWLSILALHMHSGGKAGAAVPEQTVREALKDVLAPEALDRFIEAVRNRGGLREERAELFQFSHLTFQEFLAARRIAKQREAGLDALQPHLTDPWWREVALLTYGFAQTDYEEFARTYLDWLTSQPGEAKLAGLELAGAALLELERPNPDLRAGLAKKLCAGLTDPATRAPGVLRARAGTVLAELGDPRFDPDHWHLPAEPDFGFVRIPAGPFLRGTRQEDFEPLMKALGVPKDDWKYHEAEINPRPETYVDEFYIARYPVTAAQFRAFVEDRRAADPNFKLADEDALNGLPTHPVSYVTWYEAMAYCEWLTKKMQEARTKNQDSVVEPLFLNSQF